MKADGTPYTVYTPYSKTWKQKYFEEKPTTFPSEQFLSSMVKTKPFYFPFLKEIGFEKVEMEISKVNITEETIRNGGTNNG